MSTLVKGHVYRITRFKNAPILFLCVCDYNAGQKKHNSELIIFRDPPEGGGSTLNTVQHTQ